MIYKKEFELFLENPHEMMTRFPILAPFINDILWLSCRLHEYETQHVASSSTIQGPTINHSTIMSNLTSPVSQVNLSWTAILGNDLIDETASNKI